MFCFYPTLSRYVVEKFKQTAYSLIESRNVTARVLKGLSDQGRIVVTLAYRGPTASRRIINIEHFINVLSANLSPESFVFQTKNTTSYYITYQEQMALTAGSQIVICEHGAFQSNMMYMQRGSLLIDLRGGYGHGEFAAFRNLARMFGVFYDHVITQGLEIHKTKEFNLSDTEIAQVLGIINLYVKEKPYLHI